MLLGYSLCGLCLLDIDTQLRFLALKWIKTSPPPPPPPPNALWKGSRQMAKNMLLGPSPQGQDIF